MRITLKIKAAAIALVLGAVAAPPGWAQDTESQVVFTRKQWEVRVVAFPDSSLACVARVQKPGSSFSIWSDGHAKVQLQFFSRAWSFTEDSADIVVQIDRRAKWDMSNADLNENSVLFNLPNSDAGKNFLVEIARGSRIKLFNTGGNLIEDWSLSGSLASMNALIDCADSLLQDNDSDPFN